MVRSWSIGVDHGPLAEDAPQANLNLNPNGQWTRRRGGRCKIAAE
jgi:hypothetical protein